jgi:hypothetical protein
MEYQRSINDNQGERMGKKNSDYNKLMKKDSLYDKVMNIMPTVGFYFGIVCMIFSVYIGWTNVYP